MVEVTATIAADTTDVIVGDLVQIEALARARLKEMEPIGPWHDPEKNFDFVGVLCAIPSNSPLNRGRIVWVKDVERTEQVVWPGKPDLRELARGNIERHLGDVVEDGATADSVFNEAYTLAFDALHDSGRCTPDEARTIAQEVAQNYAQP
jgi:hypothetical protein